MLIFFTCRCLHVNNINIQVTRLTYNHASRLYRSYYKRYLTGWTGASCDEYDCAGVNHCYGNGQCIGSNTCQCSEGWSGPSCIVASCRSGFIRVVLR